MSDFASNPRASFDYEILETLEAGLALKGHEVKSIKTGGASLKGAYVKIMSGRPALVGAIIAPYQPANTPDTYDPQATRYLLLTKKQIDTLLGLKGLTLIPLKLYAVRGRVKLLIGIAKGKKKYDKREAIKKKDVARARQRGIED
jgi:SsrA-binding protein